jgi:hypothetical protein
MEQLSLTPGGPAASAEAPTPSLQQQVQLAHVSSASLAVRVAQLCVQMHQSVEKAAEDYYQELRRRSGITQLASHSC